MMLLYLILILVVAGILALLTGKRFPASARIISFIALAACLVMIIPLFFRSGDTGSEWLEEFKFSWIPQLGIGIHLALDGLSLLMLALTFFIGIISIVISRNESFRNPGFFYFNMLWTLAGITGVFLSIDLFLFYFFWELMIVPMYFIISIWGHEKRNFASYKFFIYTQAGGLLMLLSVIGIYLVHGSSTGTYTFELNELTGTIMTKVAGFLLMAGFLAGFLVKLPAFLLHTWLPDAYTESPTSGTIVLASLMSKTAVYGLIRFAIPLFPQASQSFAPAAMTLGVVGILYGAKLAFAQTDLKRLIAYSSLSHMGFVLIGIYSFNELAYQGVVVQIIAHGISTGAMFIIAGQLYERLNTRDIGKMGGLWDQMPALGAMGMIFSMALLGLPGLGNFIAEFLILAGAFKSSILFSCLASLGLILATVYSLRIMQRVFFGERKSASMRKDLDARETIILGLLVAVIVATGVLPQPVINNARPAIMKSIKAVEEKSLTGADNSVIIVGHERD
jgi:NADH-quinone oxidoreductase subunit M